MINSTQDYIPYQRTVSFQTLTLKIMEQIVIGGKSSRVRKQALRDPKYSLKDLFLDARREETSKTQAADPVLLKLI